MYIHTFLFRMTDTVTSKNIDLPYWDMLYKSSNGRITNDWQTGKDLEGNSRGLTEVLFRHLPERNWEKPRTFQIGQSVSWPRFELDTSRMKIYSVMATRTFSVTIFCLYFWNPFYPRMLWSLKFRQDKRTRYLRACFHCTTGTYWLNSEPRNFKTSSPCSAPRQRCQLYMLIHKIQTLKSKVRISLYFYFQKHNLTPNIFITEPRVQRLNSKTWCLCARVSAFNFWMKCVIFTKFGTNVMSLETIPTSYF
jgi:hypothetical protein